MLADIIIVLTIEISPAAAGSPVQLLSPGVAPPHSK